jgi:single stranded DNA-binding protein
MNWQIGRLRSLFSGGTVVARHERISGRLGKDPEERFDKEGHMFTRFSVAVDDYDQGTTWYTVQARGNLAEWIIENFKKGAGVTCEGEVTTTSYQDRAGKTKQQLVMRAREVETWGGERCQEVETARSDAAGAPRPLSDEEQAAAYLEVLKASPPRWLRPGFGGDDYGKKFYQEHPDAFEQAVRWQAGERELPGLLLPTRVDVEKLISEVEGK